MRGVANSLRRLVGAWRFELQTSCAQGRRATRLRYAPTLCTLKILLYFSAFFPAIYRAWSEPLN